MCSYFWGVANETAPSESRNAFLKSLVELCHKMDTTRLITAAFDLPKLNSETNAFEMEDDFIENLDVVSIKVGSINSIFYFLHKAAEPFNCLEQDNLA